MKIPSVVLDFGHSDARHILYAVAIRHISEKQ